MSKTVKLVATVTMEVYPEQGQSLMDAAKTMAQIFDSYLTIEEMPFRDDYGATTEEIESGEATERLAGYEGPYVTDVKVPTVNVEVTS